MNKKKLVTGLLSAAFLGGVLVTTALPAHAQDFNGQSTGSVKFKPGKLIDPPDDEDTDPGTNDGEIGLLYVPKEFNFAETAVPTSIVSTNTVVPIDSNWEGSPATPTSTPVGSNPTTKRVAVGDVRGKRAAGWKLNAKLTAPLLDSGSGKILTGATITMNQTLKDLDPVTGTSTPVVPTVHTPDTVTAAVTLDLSSSLIMSASAETGPGNADGKGEGYWQGEFKSINLVIPPGAMNAVLADEQYEGTVDWTLTDSI